MNESCYQPVTVKPCKLTSEASVQRCVRRAQQRFRERQRVRLTDSEERLRHLSGALAQLQVSHLAQKSYFSIMG